MGTHKHCFFRVGTGNPSRRRHHHVGLTLVEVLVVIAIIGLLAALLLPAVQAVRESARRSHCANNLSQFGKALSGYQARDGRFPAAGRGYSWCNSGTANTGDARILNSNGMVELLPFLEQQAVFDQFDLTAPFSDCGGSSIGSPSGQWWLNKNAESNVVSGFAGNAKAAANAISAFRCPSDNQNPESLNGPYASSGAPQPAATSYDFIGTAGQAPTEGSFCNVWRRAGVNARMFGQNSVTTPAHVIDGLSNTFAMGETTVNHYVGSRFAWGLRCLTMQGIDPYRVNDWTSSVPAQNIALGQLANHQHSAGSLHPGGCHFVTADGAVHFFSELTDSNTLQSLVKMRDGKVTWPQ